MPARDSGLPQVLHTEASGPRGRSAGKARWQVTFPPSQLPWRWSDRGLLQLACASICKSASFPATLLCNPDGTGRILKNFEFLGAAFSDDAFIQAHTEARVGKAGVLLEALAELEDPQVGLRLPACAGLCRMVHSTRCNPPATQAAALAHFDGLVQQCFGGLTGIHVTAEQWRQASRGLAHAGLGLRSCLTRAPLDPGFSAAAVRASYQVATALHTLQGTVGAQIATRTLLVGWPNLAAAAPLLKLSFTPKLVWGPEPSSMPCPLDAPVWSQLPSARPAGCA